MTVHLGAGVDRVTALSARVRIELATLLGARTPRGQCCARVPEFVAHDATPATAAGRRERPRAASSATTREPAKLHELGGAHFRPLRDSQDSARRRHAQGSARRHRTGSSPVCCRPASTKRWAKLLSRRSVSALPPRPATCAAPRRDIAAGGPSALLRSSSAAAPTGGTNSPPARPAADNAPQSVFKRPRGRAQRGQAR